MQTNGTNAPSRSTHLLLGALLAAILLLRKPASLLHPQFWAEDGTLFFQDAFNHGFWPTILQPASGYLHSLPRLVAGFSLLFPLEQAPLVFNLSAFAVQLVPAFYLLSSRMARHIPSFFARAVAALLYIALPASYETHANLTNSHWHLALIAVCILVARAGRRPAGPDARNLHGGAVFPDRTFFNPVSAARRTAAARGRQGALDPLRSRVVPVVIAAGALIQLGFASVSARVGAVVAQSGPLSPQELMTVVSMHTFFNAIFGINGVARFYRTLPPFAYGLGLCALAFFLFVAVRDRVKPLLILFYLAALSIALSIIFPLNDLRIWLHPEAGPRYFLFACVFVLFATLHLALASRSFKRIGYVFLAAAVVIGIPADFFHPGQPDIHWTDHAAVFQVPPSRLGLLRARRAAVSRGDAAAQNVGPARTIRALPAADSSVPGDRRFFRQPPGESLLVRGEQRQISPGGRVGNRRRRPGAGRRSLRPDRRQGVSRRHRLAGGYRHRRACVPGLRLLPVDPDRRDRPRLAPGVDRRAHPRRHRLLSATGTPDLQR